MFCRLFKMVLGSLCFWAAVPFLHSIVFCRYRAWINPAWVSFIRPYGWVFFQIFNLWRDVIQFAEGWLDFLFIFLMRPRFLLYKVSDVAERA